MANLGGIFVELGLSQGKFDQGLSKAKSDLKKFRREADTSLKGLSLDFGKGLVGGLAGGLAVQQFTRFADGATRITNALKVAGLEGKNLSDTYARLGKIALDNGANFEAVGSLYAKVSANAKTLGINSKQAEEFTRRIAVGLRASGTDATAASAGIMQLNQALASGVLRGDEFNSVAENLPVVAKAIADGMGVTVGKLRELAAEGALDAKTVFDAFMKGSKDLDAQAAKTSTTFSQAFENISTALTIAAGTFNETTGASKAFAGAVETLVVPAIVGLGEAIATTNEKHQKLAGDLQKFAQATGIEQGVIAAIDALKDLGREADPLVAAFQSALDQIRTVRAALAADLAGIAGDYDKTMASLRATGQAGVADGIEAEFERLNQKVKDNTFSVKDLDTVIAQLVATGNTTADSLAGDLELIQAKFVKAGDAATKSFDEAGKAMATAFGEKALSMVDALIERIGTFLPASVTKLGAALRDAARMTPADIANLPTVPLPASVSETPERRPRVPNAYFDDLGGGAGADKIKREAEQAADKLNAAIARQAGIAVDAATTLLGKSENTDAASINAFLRRGGVNLDAATEKWCAAFINSALAQVGIKGTGSNAASSFLNFGKGVDLANLQRGDVLVDSNGVSAGQPGAHVGFATGQIRATAAGISQVEILSGNASNQVKTDWIDASEVVARRATDAFQLPADALTNLTEKSAEAKAQIEAQTAALAAQEQAYEQVGQVASTAFNGLSTALADGKIEGEELLQIMIQIAQQLLTMKGPGDGSLLGSLFGGLGGGGGAAAADPWAGLRGGGGGAGGGIIGGILSLFGFAKGGIARNGRPLRTFANGGVSRSAAIFGETGRAEAAVPLPDGKSIPVRFQDMPTLGPRQGLGGPQEITLRVIGEEGPMFRPTIQAESRGVAVKVVRSGITEHDKQINRTFGARMSNAQARQL